MFAANDSNVVPVDDSKIEGFSTVKKKHYSDPVVESKMENEEPEKKKKAVQKLQQVTLMEVCSEGFEEHSDNTFLRFVVLHIRKAQLKYVRTFNAGKSSKWSGVPNQVYDRIVTAADLSSDKGMCFCFLYSTQRESDFKLMQFKMNNCGVGEVGEVLEPVFLKKTLGNSDVPILEHKRPLVYIPSVTKLLNKFPVIKFMDVSVVNFGTRFFLLKGMHLHIQSATMEDPICTGYMCDRQEIKTAEGTPCGCLVQSDRCNVVLSCTVFVKSQEGEQLFSVKNFRSWVFTKLLCGNSLSDLVTKADFNDDESFDQMRRHLSIIVDYVNANGGWSVIGWFRVGMLQDAADSSQDLPRNQTELIAAETVSPHISRLCPTEIDIRELQQFQLPKKGFAMSDVAQAQGCI
jgi:hypothetical protein